MIMDDNKNLKKIDIHSDEYMVSKCTSKILDELHNGLITGNSNEIIEVIKQLIKPDHNSFNVSDEFKKNGYFEEIPDLSKEDKLKVNDDVNSSLNKSYLIGEYSSDMLKSQSIKNIVDVFNDYYSLFFDGKNPYLLLKLLDEIDSEDFKIFDKLNGDYNYTIYNKYKNFVESDVYSEYVNLCGIWVRFVDDESIENKYLNCVMHEMIELQIKYYKLYKHTIIDTNKCHRIGHKCIQILNDKFDPSLFVDKYFITLDKHNTHDFERLFINQFVELINPSPKLF